MSRVPWAQQGEGRTEETQNFAGNEWGEILESRAIVTVSVCALIIPQDTRPAVLGSSPSCG